MESVEPQKLLEPQRWSRQLVIADAMIAEGRTDGALDLFRRLLEESLPLSMRLDVLFGAARAFEAAGRWAQAQASYRDYLEESKDIEPDLRRIEGVAEAFATHGEAADAAQLYRRLMVLAGDVESSVRYSFKAAALLEDSGNLEQAAEEFLKIAYQYPAVPPWPARCRLRAALLYEKLERYDAAERQYRVVAEKWSGTSEGRTAAERLRALVGRRESVKEELIKPPQLF